MSEGVTVVDEAPVTPERAHALAPWAVLVAVLTLSVVIRAQVPVLVLADAAIDDTLAVRTAAALRDGLWLGTYDQLILAKGPGYPIFVAAMAEAGIALKVGEAMAHAAAAGLVSLAVARISAARWVAVIAGAAVALDPAMLGDEAARVNRLGFYASVCIALFALIVLVVCPTGPRGDRPAGLLLSLRVLVRITLGVVTGAVLAAYLVTREERVWLGPSVALAVVGLLVLSLSRPRSTFGPIWARLLPPVAGLLATAAVAAVGVGEVTARNEAAYGVRQITDFSDGSFADLFDALAAVDTGPPRDLVPISSAQRTLAYQQSPTFAQVRTGLEVDQAFWVQVSCEAVDVCDDYAGGWFPWALRGAIWAQLAPVTSAAQAEAFMARATAEIRAGCDTAYACRPPPIAAFFPAVEAIEAWQVTRLTATGVDALVRFRTGSQPERPGSAADWERFADVVVGVADTPEAQASDPPGWVRSWRWMVTGVFGALLALLAVPALGGLVVSLSRGTRQERAMAVVGAAAGVTVGVRLTLLALIESTSFPAIATGYLLPVFAPALVSVVIGTWCLARRVAFQVG